MLKNYTLKVLLGAFFTCLTLFVDAQQININTMTPADHPLTIPQTSTYTTNNGSGAVTWIIKNTNAFPAILDTVHYFIQGAGTQQTTLWYSATSLTGPTTAAAPAWTQITTQNVNAPLANTMQPLLSGLNFVIPGNTTYRFQIIRTGLGYGGTGTWAAPNSPTPDSFVNSGVLLGSARYTIGGNAASNSVAYGQATMAFNPRSFVGKCSFTLQSTPCAGVPNHDTVIGNMNPCPGVQSCYYLTGNNPNSGLTYQWFQSTTSATGPWTATSPADTNSSYCTIPPQPGPTWYTCVTTCTSSSASDTATAIMVTPATFSPFSPCYCGNSSPTIVNLGDIGQFSIGNLSNPATAPPLVTTPYTSNTYSNFDTLTPVPTFIQGQTYPVSMQAQFGPSFTYNGWTKAWIDYDHNTSWDPLTEEILNSTVGAPGFNTSANFTVPTTAQPGLTRLRVVYSMLGNQAGTQPCGTYTRGETEDYVVNILAAGPYDPAITNITVTPNAGCMDSNGTVIITMPNFGSQTLDLSLTPVVVRLRVQGPNGLNVYTDTLNSGILLPFAANNTFNIYTGVNLYDGGCYSINTDTLTLLGASNTNLINDSLFAPVVVCNSRPNPIDYNLCLNDTIPTGNGLAIANCPTGLVQDSVIIPFTLYTTTNNLANPTQCSALGAGQFAYATLPALPPGANILSGELSASNLALAGLTFTTNPSLARLSLHQGALPTTAANVFHNGLQGSALTGNPGTFPYLSNPPAADLNAMYAAVGVGNQVEMGHWSTNRCTAPNIQVNSGGPTVVNLKIVYEYVPMGVSWYETPSGGVPISTASVLDPLTTPNSIVNNSSTTGPYTFYGACAADTNCRVGVDLIVTSVAFDSVAFTNVNCFGDSTGTIEVSGVSAIPGNLNYNLTGPVNPPTNATGLFTGLPAGNYIVSIIDTNTGCTSLDSTVTISAPPPFLIDSITSTTPSCTPGGDATMTVYASGGTPPIVTYNNGTTVQAGNVFTNQAANTYTVTVTDNNGCTVQSTHTVVAPTPPTWNNIALTDVQCFGDTSGIIVASATPGSSGISTYATIAPNTQGPVGTFTGVGAGTYTVRATDSNNCTIDSIVTITSPSQLAFATAGSTDVSCNGGSDGTISVSATGGTPGYSYQLNPPSTSQPTGNFAGLMAGNYTVRITDTNNCTHDTILVVNEPAALVIDTASVLHVSCNGDSTGQIVMTNTGGTGVVTYSTPAPGNQITPGTITDLPAGTYTITGTDANNCTATTSVTILQSPTLVISNITSTIPSCVPGCDAVMTVTATGGTPTYSYNNGTLTQPNSAFTAQCAGNYTVTVTDANGCTATSTHTISAAGGPTWNTVSSTNPACFGDTSGTIVVTTTPGTSPGITYSIAPPATQNPSGTFTGLGANTYTVTATDGNNCAITTLVTITTPSQLGFDSAVVNNVNCNGGNSGSIQVGGQGGVLPYSYNITAGPSTPGPNTTGSFTNLTAGTYTVQVLDSNNNCTHDTILTITEPPVLSIDTASVTQVLCNGDSTGQIVLTYTGGTAPMANYTIAPNLGNQTVLGTITDLPAGTYTITGTDANGCTAATSVTLTAPPAFSITNVTSTIPTCVPGCDANMTITATGGVMPYQSYNNGTLTQTSNVFANQCAGNYTVTVTDANGCTATSTHLITAPGSPTWTTVTSTNVLCNGDSNGTATLNTTGGTAPVNISITAPAPVPPSVVQTPANSGNITGMPAGSYTIRATDAVGCNVSTVVVITEPAVLAFTGVVVDSVDCNGGSDGSITTTISGGNAGVKNYSITPGTATNTTGTFTNLAVGTYTITVSDANNCSATTSATIYEPAALSYTGVTVTNVSCNNANDGTIIAGGAGGVAPRVITLLPNVAPTSTPPATFTGLGGGNQTIRITDANNCTLDSVVNILEPALLAIDTTSGTNNILCFGDSTGTLVMNNTGGTGTVTYVMTAPPTGVTNSPNGTFNNVPAGTYTITGTDASGCTAVTTITLNQPSSAVQITNVASTPPSCNPGNDGTITVTATGGTSPIEFGKDPTYLPLQPTGAFTGLPGGGHIVRAQDANGCFADTSVTLVTPGAPVWTSVTSTPTICNGDSTGTITGVATGSSAITYALTPLNGGTQTAGNFTNLPAGSYSISATDANNCSLVSAVSVGSAPAINYDNVTVTNVSCNAANDGAIAATFSGGTGALSMSINPGPGAASVSPANYTSLAAGTQTLTITDASNCSVDSIVTITEPTVLSISQTSSANVLCRDDSSGSVTVICNGGTPAYTYTIAPSYANTQQFPLGTFTNLPAGTYTVTGTDVNGCTAATTVTITQPATAISINSVVGVTPSCTPGGDGTITVNATGGTGGLLYNLGANAPATPNLFSNLNSGPYTITVTDANACTVSSVYTLANSATPVWTSVTSTNVLCNGDSSGTITGVATGGTGTIAYSLAPNLGTQTGGSFSNLPVGGYLITASDANNCTVTSNVTLTEPAPISISSVATTDVSCNGGSDGSMTVNALGGSGTLSYGIILPGVQAPNTPPNTFTNLAATTYTVRVTDTNNCTYDTAIAIAEPSPLVINTSSSVDVLCNGDSTGSLQINTTGGVGSITYSIPSTSNTSGANSGNFTGLPAGTYNVVSTDGNGCTVAILITINEPTPLTNSFTTMNVTCFGGSDGSVTITGNGGVAPYTYGLPSPTSPLNTTGLFNNLTAGIYQGVVTDSNGCTDSTATITITEPTQMVFTSVTKQDILCFGDSTGTISVASNQGTGAHTYTINPNRGTQASSGNFINLIAGTYIITATDANGCTINTQVTVNQNPQIVWNITNTEEVCFGDSTAVITFSASGGVGPYTYRFDDPSGPYTGQTSYGGLTTGTYLLEAQDAVGCEVDTNYTLLGPDPISFTEFDVTPTTCLDTEDGKLTVTATGGRGSFYDYSLEPGTRINTNGIFRDLAAGQYTLFVNDTAGCEIDTMITINLPSNPLTVSISKEDLGCHGRGNEGTATANVSGGTPPYTYLWSTTPVQITPVAIGLYQGLHTLDVVDAQGCLERDTIFIEPGPCCQEVFLPNAFSPNGDGRNDEFRVLSTAGIELTQFEVYDRWGVRVWQTNNVRQSWDGTYGGEPVEVGTFHYVMRYRCLTDGQNYTKKGDVTVIR